MASEGCDVDFDAVEFVNNILSDESYPELTSEIKRNDEYFLDQNLRYLWDDIRRSSPPLINQSIHDLQLYPNEDHIYFVGDSYKLQNRPLEVLMNEKSFGNMEIEFDRQSSVSTMSGVNGSKIGYRCVFCKRNGETVEVYTSHVLHNDKKEVICPVLFKHRCENCGATGKNAHTLTYCPRQPISGKRPVSTSIIVKSSLRKSNGKLRDGRLPQF